MAKRHKVISVYILAHFVVDFACAFMIFRTVYDSGQWLTCLLIYNFCAFALQMPIGLIADRWNHNALCAAIGCGLVALSFGFGSMVVAAGVIAGIGNGLFHVGGGIEVLNVSRKKPILLGIFVSPGALGIYLGTIFGKQSGFPVLAIVLVLLMVILAILLANYLDHRSFGSDNVPISFQEINSSGILLALGCLFLVVFLRSYIGMTSSFDWKSESTWATVYISAVILGKISGGFLAFKLGAVKTSIVSLDLAAVLFLLSDNPIPGVAAVFFFNMTMPITLWAVARILYGCKGFSFGLLTFGLFLGFVPVYFNLRPLLLATVGFSIGALVSLVLLVLGLRKVVE